MIQRADRSRPSTTGNRITIATTVFHTADRVVTALLASIDAAAHRLLQMDPSWAVELIVVDNSPAGDDANRLHTVLSLLPMSGLTIRLLSGQGNVGYGAANNLALLSSQAEILIVANPDLTLAPEALIRLVEAFETSPEAGLITPCFTRGAEHEHLCKRFPSLVVLFGRGFLPPAFQPFIKGALDRYRMADRSPDDDFWDPPIVSGAFMAFRGCILKAVGGFDERFFLYFEDFDLSLRVSAVTRIFYSSRVRVTHAGGHTARRGLRLIGYFARSALRFWMKHGFRFLRVEDTSPRRCLPGRHRPIGD